MNSDNILAVNIPNIITIMIMVMVGGAALTLITRGAAALMQRRPATEE